MYIVSVSYKNQTDLVTNVGNKKSENLRIVARFRRI